MSDVILDALAGAPIPAPFPEPAPPETDFPLTTWRRVSNPRPQFTLDGSMMHVESSYVVSVWAQDYNAKERLARELVSFVNLKRSYRDGYVVFYHGRADSYDPNTQAYGASVTLTVFQKE